MDINIKLSVDAPAGWKRRVLLYVCSPLALVAAVSAVAQAAWTANDPATWAGAGQKVQASKLVSDLNQLEVRLSTVEGKVGRIVVGSGAASYSIGAVYKGATDTTYDGAGVGGYVQAKAKCVVQLGSQSAHMCTSDEMARSAQMGLLPSSYGSMLADRAWFLAYHTNPSGSEEQNECLGFTSNNPAYDAMTALNNNGSNNFAPKAGNCSGKVPIACCD